MPCDFIPPVKILVVAIILALTPLLNHNLARMFTRRQWGRVRNSSWHASRDVGSELTLTMRRRERRARSASLDGTAHTSFTLWFDTPLCVMVVDWTLKEVMM